jgi:hypothetical protein
MLTINQIHNLISTIRHLLEEARCSGDCYEYCRLSEELRLAQAALEAQLQPLAA